jgi:hypothetical protein
MVLVRPEAEHRRQTSHGEREHLEDYAPDHGIFLPGFPMTLNSGARIQLKADG